MKKSGFKCNADCLLYLFWVCGFLIFPSCSDVPVETVYAGFNGQKGVFISCEGNYMYGNASLSFYDRESKTVHNRIYYARNRVPLGDVAQSVCSDGKYLYIVVNNSGKIVVIDPSTLEHKGTITGLTSPREIHFVNDQKAYVSDLYARSITVFNPQTLTVTRRIPVSDGKPDGTGHPTESFVQVGSFVYVTCWSFDNYVLVIDALKDEVVDSIAVGRQPRHITKDRHNRLWITCEGDYTQNGQALSPPSLIRIDPETRTVEQVYSWPKGAPVPRGLQAGRGGDTLYYIAGDVYKMPVSAGKLPDVPFLRAGGKLVYSLGLDPESGDLYLSDAIDYAQDAIIYRFSAKGVPLDTFRTGINPGDFYFR